MFNGFFSKSKSVGNHNNLDGFLRFFQLQDKLTYSGDLYQDFISQLGGRQFRGGLFNSFRMEDLTLWRTYISDAFPEIKGQFYPFGYDWQGTCFAITKDSTGKEKILFIEIGSGEILTLPCSFAEFMNVEIPKKADAIFEYAMYDEWKSYAKADIPYGNCVGFIVPLFLGGEGVPKNMEISDMEVYWSILGQIRTQI